MQGRIAARELAALKLPGLPHTERGVQIRADKEGWKFTWRKIRGGCRKKYFTDLLPEDIRHALAESQIGTETTDNPPALSISIDLEIAEPETPPDLTTLKGWQRRVMDARLAILREIERLEKTMSANKAITKIIALARYEQLPPHVQKLIAMANARSGGKQGRRTLSRTSIYQWRNDLKTGGISALAPQDMEKKKIPSWTPYFLKCYQRPQNPSIPEAMEEMAKILPDSIPMPSYSQVLRFNRKRSSLDKARGRKTGSALKSIKGCRRRDTSKMLPLDVGLCDGHSYKAKVAHPAHGRPFKPEVCAVIDAATRAVVGWSAGLAESALTVADAVRHSATVNEEKPYGGVFAILYTDGGSGNKAKINTDDVTGIFTRLGTTHKTGIPGNAQGRGLVEALNKSLWIRAAKKLPTYVGNSMDKLTERNMYLLLDREIKQKGTSDQLIPWPAFLHFCQETVDAYNRRSHKALPKIIDHETGRRRHMAPLEMWAWHMSQGWNPKDKQLSEAEIEALFRPQTEVKTLRGEVRLFGNTYYNKTLEHYHGRKVAVGYEVQDGSKVQVWDCEQRLICYAHFEKNKTSYFPMSAVEKAREERAKRRAKIKSDQLAEIEAERRGVIDIGPAGPSDELVEELAAKYNSEPTQPEPAKIDKVVPIFGTMTERYEHVKKLETIGPDDIEFLLEYYETTSGRIFKKMDGDLTLKMAQKEGQ